MKKMQVFLIIGITITLTLSIVGASYAYFKSTVIGNENASSINISAGSLKLTYTDSAYINVEKALPPWTATKTIYVQNTGTGAVSYNILWENITNTFINKEFLTYSITSNNGGGTLSKTVLPNTGNNIIILSNINIIPGVTHTYNITFNYENSSTDQSSDMEKVFSGKFKIVES
ncbi:MAG: TasA family protein [Bacilli bacterium]